MCGHFTAVFGHFPHEHRRECILKLRPLIYLVSSCDHAERTGTEWKQSEERFVSGCSCSPLHFFFFDHKRDHTHAAQLVARLDGKARGARGDYHFAQRIDRAQALDIDQQQAVGFGDQLDFPLFRRGVAARICAF